MFIPQGVASIARLDRNPRILREAGQNFFDLRSGLISAAVYGENSRPVGQKIFRLENLSEAFSYFGRFRNEPIPGQFERQLQQPIQETIFHLIVNFEDFVGPGLDRVPELEGKFVFATAGGQSFGFLVFIDRLADMCNEFWMALGKTRCSFLAALG